MANVVYKLSAKVDKVTGKSTALCAHLQHLIPTASIGS